MIGIKFSRALAIICGALCLQGCGALRNQTDYAANGMRAVRSERVVNVTMMGGSHLNPGLTGTPRPVQLCVYLVSDEKWLPGSWLDDDKCRASSVDAHVFAIERRVLSPEQAQQVNLKMPSDKDGWVLIDPDFGSQAAASGDFLRLKTNSGEFSSHFVVVNGTRAFDGMEMRRPPPNAEASAPH